jgi:5'-methylthioadenosine phosphorylase
MLGIIGGSGLYKIEGITLRKTKKVKTTFGKPSDSYKIGALSDREIVFLPRHGAKHSIPPHKVNYRANVWGFKELGVKRIIAISAVGGISPKVSPGAIVVPDQIIDMTSNREATFHEKDNAVHVDFTEPYCPEMRRSIIGASKTKGIDIKASGTYVCVNGPRLETRAEIQFFSRIGADIVGMTAMPEAALVREVEICFGGISVVTNYAAGVKKRSLRANEVGEVMKEAMGNLGALLEALLHTIPQERTCDCKNALNEAMV